MLVSAIVKLALFVMATSPAPSAGSPMAAGGGSPGRRGWRNQSSWRSSLADIRGPIEADGGVQMVPAPVQARCRYAFLNAKRDYKLYRLFVRPGVLEYAGWCQAVEARVRHRCGCELALAAVQWRRCDPDGRDLLWLHGFVATFELHVPEERLPLCVQEALPETVPGSLVDYMGHLGCYEAYGWEVEF